MSRKAEYPEYFEITEWQSIDLRKRKSMLKEL
jgi:hypothetical protein